MGSRRVKKIAQAHLWLKSEESIQVGLVQNGRQVSRSVILLTRVNHQDGMRDAVFVIGSRCCYPVLMYRLSFSENPYT